MSQTSEESREESEHFVDFDFMDTGYGKNHIKLLRIKREGAVHHVKEFQVDTQLTLCSKKDYLFGDNSDIVATDSQKNIVYILAKIHGLKSPEDFGLLLCSHFLSKYPRVTKVKISIEEHPWQRMVTDGVPHNHAFISTPTAIRFACVTCERGAMPDIESGMKNLRVMKTTQSAFEHFIHDEFATLPDCPERIFSTVIYSKWKYGMTAGLDYDYAWNTVKDSVLYAFAGSPDTGIFSPSVQNTLYLAQKEVLEKIPQMSWIEVQLPNKHYTPVDFSQFKYFGVKPSGSENEVFLPSDYPAGNIRAVLGRKSLLSPDMLMLQSKL
ncbi:Uricase [Orchesella cincta]|uniref:Uricase n=1 Tax=Orchesella cincta TaxID=48709 RepID=A0A1D2N2Q4_ORCCI|nr:Uricase [Orchesella cincta]